MMKIFLKIIGAVILLLILVVVGFITLVDPNQFKPSIESLAKKQGIALSIEGDLSWKLWPSIGLGAEGVKLGSLVESEKRLAEIEQMSFLLAIRPLFSGKFQADHLLLSGAKVDLVIDAKGQNNWSFLTDSKTPAAETASDESESSLDLNIREISIEKSQIAYTNQTAEQKMQLTDFNLNLTDVNTQQQPFPVSISTAISMQTKSEPEMRLLLEMGNNIKVDKKLASVEVSEGKVQFTIVGKQSVTIPVSYDALIKDLQNQLSYSGHLNLEEISLRNLLSALDIVLDTANAEAASKFALSSSFEGDDKKISLNDIKLVLDESHFDGSVAVTDFEKSLIKVNLKGDKLNLDDYLPPASEEESVEVADTPDQPLPMESLRDINLNAKIQLQELIIKKLKLTSLDWKLLAKNGMLEQQLDGQAYSGKILFKNQLDARSEKANLTFDAALESVQVNTLLDDLFEHDKEKLDLQGAIHLRALGGANGATVNQLIKSLQSNATFSGAELRITPINLQKQFCKLVSLVNRNPDTDQVWQDLTQLTEVSGSIKLRDEKITIDSFKAGVENLILSSSGQVDLGGDKYDLLLPFKLLKSATATSAEVSTSQQQGQGCVIGDTYWMERGMSLLRCKGKLSGMDPLKDCGPDKEMLIEITKDYAEYKIKQKHGAKIEEKKQEVKAKVEDKKKKLFDKLQKKLGGSTEEASVEEKPTEEKPAESTIDSTQSSETSSQAEVQP
jgi:AsmA protein